MNASHAIARRCSFALAVLLLLPTVFTARAARAEVTSPVLLINEDAATHEVTSQPLRGNVSVVMGSGGNIAVLATPEGKFLVDGGIAVSRDRIRSVLDKLGGGPVRFVVNTHYHWDHTDGNAWLHQEGATIVAHENTLRRLKSGTRVIEWGFTFPPAPAAALPTVTVRSEKRFPFGDEMVVARNYGYGHTDGDLAVHFLRADVLHVGDLWWKGHYPFIDNGAGGGIDGVIHWVDECIRASTAHTIIIPGHGDVGTRADLVGYRDMLVAVRSNVAALKKSGKTLAETVAARPTAAYDAVYGDFLIGPAFFIQLVYMGV